MYAAVATIKPTPSVSNAIFMAKAAFMTQVAAAVTYVEAVCAI